MYIYVLLHVCVYIFLTCICPFFFIGVGETLLAYRTKGEVREITINHNLIILLSYHRSLVVGFFFLTFFLQWDIAQPETELYGSARWLSKLFIQAHAAENRGLPEGKSFTLSKTVIVVLRWNPFSDTDVYPLTLQEFWRTLIHPGFGILGWR